jgi:ribosomal protein S18 acetylase RimI-like enzyme
MSYRSAGLSPSRGPEARCTPPSTISQRARRPPRFTIGAVAAVPTDLSVLDNAVWHALTGAHAHLAHGTGRARRYDPDVSVFGAVEAFGAGAWRDLAAALGPGGVTALFGPALEPAPSEWKSLGDGHGYQMVCVDLASVEHAPARRLTADDVPQMLELVAIAQPGPFQVRTIEMGDYFGVFDDDRLVAMAGERLRPPGFTEISAVCTHPDARRRGLASALTALVADRIVARGETPFLHFAAGNDSACRVYERLGFEVRGEVNFTVVQAPAASVTP